MPRTRSTAWHYWRHASTLCGAWKWLPEHGTPKLELERPSGKFDRVCRRCDKRRHAKLRRLSRDW